MAACDIAGIGARERGPSRFLVLSRRNILIPLSPVREREEK